MQCCGWSDSINQYCARVGDSEKRRLYDVLAGGDQHDIRNLSEQIDAAMLDQASEPDGAACRSQPIGAYTNQTSVEAGFGRGPMCSAASAASKAIDHL